MNRCLVVGASGFLGRSLMKALGARGVGSYLSQPFSGGIQYDVSRDSLHKLAQNAIDGVTHVIALHAIANPDTCFLQRELTRHINVDSTIRILKEIHELGLIPVFMSTDYVFDGTKGWRREDEPPCPTTEYGRQKAEVEEWLTGQCKPYLICRTSKLVSGQSGVQSVLGQVADDFLAGRTTRWAVDQVFSPAFVDDVSNAMIALMEGGHTGLFHIAGDTPISRYDLVEMFAQQASKKKPSLNINIGRCNLDELPFAEARPLDTSLCVEKITDTIDYRPTPLYLLCERIAEDRFGY